MDLFVLSASLGLNITGFEGGINTARKLLKQFAQTVVDFSKDVVTTGMGFDKQMSAVQAVMGLTENTTKNMKTMNDLREYALGQARDSIFTAEETATAYYYMGMAGWNAEQSMAGLPGVMSLAAASGESLKLTSDMVTDSLTAFGLGAGQASHFSDVLAVTATNANTDVARMQQTFKNLAPIAGSLGYSIEDVALSVGLIANSGIKGSQAGTALRNIFTRIATNAGATTKDLGALQIVTDNLGVSFYTAEGRARPWGEVLTDLRKAWKNLDPSKVNEVTAAFGEFSAESQSADEIMTEFANDLDTWTTEWNGLTTTVEREEFASKLESQFAILGISMRDSNNNLREFSAVAQDARVKLGGLSDEEQIYYGKQIGSLRGISGWLALMTASNEDVQQLTAAIENADGAAQAMANTRLDNLWGDVTRLKAEFDVLKIALYDDVKSPLRDLAQYATSALKNITNAVNEKGLLGGIQQLGTEIDKFSEDYREEIQALGASIVPILNEFLSAVTPAFIGMATTLGAAFGKGLLQGIKQSVTGNWSSILFGDAGPGIGLPGAWEAKHVGKENMGIPLGEGVAEGILEGAQQGLNDTVDAVSSASLVAAQNYFDSLSLTNADLGTVTVDADVQLNPYLVDIIQAKLDEAIANGKTTVKIGDVEFSTDYTAQQIADAITEGAKNGSTEMEAIINTYATSSAEVTGSIFKKKISDAGAEGGAQMMTNVSSNVNGNAVTILRTFVNTLSGAGSSGGSLMVSTIGGLISSAATSWGDTTANKIGSAGRSAGNSLSSGIQKVLNGITFGINIVGTIASIFGSGKTKKYAKAMTPGYILNGATVFGFDRQGTPLVGGEAGPEAIIGTRSLADMIENAVARGTGHGEINNTINIYQQPGQDARELAEIVQRELVRIGRQQRAVYV